MGHIIWEDATLTIVDMGGLGPSRYGGNGAIQDSGSFYIQHSMHYKKGKSWFSYLADRSGNTAGVAIAALFNSKKIEV